MCPVASYVLGSRFLSPLNYMLVTFDLICVVVTNLLTLITAMLINIPDSARAFCLITKQCLLGSAPLAGDHQIPLEGLTLGY